MVIEITGIFRNTISEERIESGSGRRREQYSVGCFDLEAPPPHYGIFFRSLTSRSTFRLFSPLRVVKRSNARKREASWTAESFSTNERQTRAATSFRSRTISSENPAFLSLALYFPMDHAGRALTLYLRFLFFPLRRRRSACIKAT